MSDPRARGFTLLELLVAMAIFAIVGVMALTGYTQLERQSETVEQRLARTRDIQTAVQAISSDIEQMEPRPIRSPIGDTPIPAVVAGGDPGYVIAFTRAGWSNTAGVQRPTEQRVAYRLEGGELWRDSWPVLDRSMAVEPVKRKLLSNVRSVTVRLMDPARSWVDHWPENQNPDPAAARQRPAAVEVVIDLEDWGEIRRLVEVPG
ncbi:MAG: type II secretion system minor pseudopilin GspJ [Candidatus Binatia bacterium]